MFGESDGPGSGGILSIYRKSSTFSFCVFILALTVDYQRPVPAGVSEENHEVN